METSKSKICELQGKIEQLKARLLPMQQLHNKLYNEQTATEVAMGKQGKTQDEIDTYALNNTELNTLHHETKLLEDELQNLFKEQAKEIDRMELETCLKYNFDGD